MAWKESRASRRARVARQLRDREGKWIDMGGSVKWHTKDGKYSSGVVEGFEGEDVIVKTKSGQLTLVNRKKVEPIKAKAHIFKGKKPKSNVSAKKDKDAFNRDVVRIQDNTDDRITTDVSELQVGDRIWAINSPMGSGFDNGSNNEFSVPEGRADVLENSGFEVQLDRDGAAKYGEVRSISEGKFVVVDDGTSTGKVIPWDHQVLADDREITDAITPNSAPIKQREETKGRLDVDASQVRQAKEPTPAEEPQPQPVAPATPTPAPVKTQESPDDTVKRIQAEIAKERDEYRARPQGERNLLEAGFKESDVEAFNKAESIDDLERFTDMDGTYDDRLKNIESAPTTAPWRTGEISKNERQFIDGPLKDKASELLGAPEAGQDYADAVQSGLSHKKAKDFALAETPDDVDKAIGLGKNQDETTWAKDFLSTSDYATESKKARLANTIKKKKNRLATNDSADGATESGSEVDTSTSKESDENTPTETNAQDEEESSADTAEAEAGTSTEENESSGDSDAEDRPNVDLTGLGLSKEDSDYVNEAGDAKEALDRLDESEAGLLNDTAKETGDKDYQKQFRAARNELMSKYAANTSSDSTDSPEAPKTGQGTPTKAVAKSLDNLGADLQDITDNDLKGDEYENALDEAVYDFKSDNGRDFFMSGSQNEEGDWEVDLFDSDNKHVGTFTPSKFKNSEEFADAIKKRADDEGEGDSAPEDSADEVYNGAENDIVDDTTPTEESEPLDGGEPEREAGTGTDAGTGESSGGPEASDDVDARPSDSAAPEEVVENRPEPTADEIADAEELADAEATDSLVESPERREVLDAIANAANNVKDLGLEDVERAVAGYTYRGDGQVNWPLRGDKLKKLGVQYLNESYNVGEAIAQIDRAMELSTFSEPKVLSRGLKMQNHDDYQVGDVISDKAFVSSTDDAEVALGFGRGGAVMKIEAPEGLHAVDVVDILQKVDPTSMMLYENEFLLPRGTRIEITGIEDLTSDNFESHFPDISSKWDSEPWRRESSKKILDNNGTTKIFHARIVSDDLGFNGEHDNTSYESTKIPPIHDPHERAWFEEYGTYEAPTTVEEMSTVISAERGNPKDASRSEKWEVTDIAEFAREYQQMRKLPFMSDSVWLPFKDSRATDKDGFSVQNLGNSKLVVRNPNGDKIATVETYANFMDTQPSDLEAQINEIKRKWNDDQEMRRQFFEPEPAIDSPESPAPSGEDIAKQIIDLDRGVPDSDDQYADAPEEAQYADVPKESFSPSNVDISDLIDMYKDKDEGLEDLPQVDSKFKQSEDKIQSDIDKYTVDNPEQRYAELQDKIIKMVDSMFEQDPESPANTDFDKRYDDALYEQHLIDQKYGPKGEGKKDSPENTSNNEGQNEPLNDTIESEEQSSPTDGVENDREPAERAGDSGASSEGRGDGRESGGDGSGEVVPYDGNFGGSDYRELTLAEDIDLIAADIVEEMAKPGFDEGSVVNLANGGSAVYGFSLNTGDPIWKVYDRDGEKVISVRDKETPEETAQAIISHARAYDRVKNALWSESRELESLNTLDGKRMSVGTIVEASNGSRMTKVSTGLWKYDNPNHPGSSTVISKPSIVHPDFINKNVKLYHEDEFLPDEETLRKMDDVDLDDQLAEQREDADLNAKEYGRLGDIQHVQRPLKDWERQEMLMAEVNAMEAAKRGKPLAREKFRRALEKIGVKDSIDIPGLGAFDGLPRVQESEGNTLSQLEWDKIRNLYVTKDQNTLNNNESLRSEKPSRGAKAWGTKVTKMVNRTELTEDTSFYRGIAASPEFAAQLQPGTVFKDKGSMSVDVNPDSAESYLKARDRFRPDSIPVLMDLKTREGQNIADVMYGEFVLAPNTRVFVTEVEDIDGIRHVTGIVNPTDDEIQAWSNTSAESDSSEDSGAGAGTSVSGESDTGADAGTSAPAGEAGADAGVGAESSASGGTPRRVDKSDFDAIERKAQEMKDRVYNNEDPMSMLGESYTLPDGSELVFDTINSNGDEGFLLLDSSGNVIGRYSPGGTGQGKKAARRAQSVWDKANGGAPAPSAPASAPDTAPLSDSPYKPGDRVMHGKHGAGEVVKIESNGKYARIRFDDRPQTKLYGIKMNMLAPEGSDSTPKAPRGKAAPSAPDPALAANSPFQVDDRVWHGKHGAGTVRRLEGNGEYARIEFDHTPEKQYGIKMSKLQSEADHIKDPSTKVTTPDSGADHADPAPSKTKVPTDEDGVPFIPGAHDAKLYVGAVVVHPKFGRGRVVRLEGNGQFVRVVFDNDPLGKPRGVVGARLEDAAFAENVERPDSK